MATAKRPRTDDLNEDKEEVEEVLTTSTSKNGAHLSFRPVLKEMHMHDPQQSKVGHCPTSWFFMRRVLKIQNCGPYAKNEYSSGLASWMMHAILDVPNPDPAAPGTKTSPAKPAIQGRIGAIGRPSACASTLSSTSSGW